MDLGASVTFRSKAMGALGKGIQQGFEMKDLSMAENERYLSGFSMDIGYLLHFPTSIGYEFFSLFKSWGDTITTVSYTHLDVYKRQAVFPCLTHPLLLSGTLPKLPNP